MNEAMQAFVAANEHPSTTNKNKPVKDFVDRSKDIKTELDAGLERIDQIDDPSLRSIALMELRDQLGLKPNEFQRLVELLSKLRDEQPPEDFLELREWSSSQRQKPVVEDLLAGSGLTVIAADGHSGKSSFCYEICEAVTNGGIFAGQFQAVQGAAIYVQVDESPMDAEVKFQRMGFNPDASCMHMMFAFTPLMIPELKAKIQSTGAKVVVMDALVSIAGGTAQIKDAEFALMLYRLNRLASDLGVAVIMIHHLKKDAKRKEVRKEDVFGTAFIYNATADYWGYWREDENGAPQFKLRVLKARSNTVPLNTTYVFDGNDEDHRLTFKGFGDRVVSLDELKTKRQQVMALLHRHPGRRWTGNEVSQHFGWNGADYACNVLAKLYEQRLGIDRAEGPSTGGRRSYVYFSVLGGEVEKSEFTTASTHDQTAQNSSDSWDF